MQSVLTRARDRSRFAPPEVAGDRPPRPFPLRALLIGSVTILALGVLVGFVYVGFLRPRAVDPDVIAKPTATASNQVRAQTPQEIVGEYFQALADGDIQRALAMGPRGGNGSERLLSPTAFAATRDLSQINGLEILTTDPEATRVQVRYRIGESPVNAEIALDRLDTGEYQLKRTTVPIQLEVPGGEGVPLLVNGESIDQGQVYEVVPGLYRLDTGLPFVAYPETSMISVIALEDVGVQKASPVPQLTREGVTAFIGAARASLDDCRATRRKAPPGCPIGMAGNAGIVESSIERTLTGDPWAAARPSLTASRQAEAQMTVTINYTLAYSWSNGSQQQPRPEQKVATVSADMLATSADQVRVTWDQ